MNKRIVIRSLGIVVLFLLVFVACKKEEIISPTFTCTEDTNVYPHPKGVRFQQIIDEYTQKGLPGISLLFSEADGTMWYGASGMADIEQGVPFQSCHVAKVASLTKIFMASLAFILSEEGKLDLDKPIRDYLSASVLKDINNAQDVTVRQLLNHTSGIFDVITDNGFYLDVLNDPPKNRNASEILHYVRKKKASFPAGTSSAYSNTNTLLLSLVIDAATGVGHEKLLREKVLNKLNLNDSYYAYHEALPAKQVAQGYYDLFNDGSIVNVSNYNTGSGHGYTGLYTNVFDLHRFAQALFVNNTLMGSMASAQMLTFNTMKEEGSDRFLGQGTMHDFIEGYPFDAHAYGHRGRELGYSADMFYFPVSGRTYCLIVNYGTDGNSSLRPVFYDLRKAIVNEVIAP